MKTEIPDMAQENKPEKTRLTRDTNARLFLTFLIAAFVMKGLLFVFLVPPWQGPDEPANLAAIAQVGSAPGFETTGPGDFPDSIRESVRASQYWKYRAWPWDFEPGAPAQDAEMFFVSGTPSIYNFIAFPAFRLGASLGVEEAMYAVRMLSVVFGALTILMVYLLASEASIGGPWIPFLATGLVAFVPQLGFITAVVNKDSLAILIGSAFMWIVISALRRPSKRAVMLGAGLLAAAVLTKPSLLALAIPGSLAVIAFGYRSVLKSRIRFVLGASALVAGALTIVMFLVLSDSDLSQYLEWAGGLMGGPAGLKAGADPGMWLDVATQSWGDFGWLNAPLPRSVYMGLLLLTGLSVFGLAAFLALRIGSLFRADPQGPMVFLVLISSLFSFAGVMAAGQASFGSAQGRWWFPVIGPFAILFALGLSTLVPLLRSRAGGAIWTTSWLSLNLWVLVYQLPNRFGF